MAISTTVTLDFFELVFMGEEGVGIDNLTTGERIILTELEFSRDLNRILSNKIIEDKNNRNSAIVTALYEPHTKHLSREEFEKMIEDDIDYLVKYKKESH